MKKTVIAIGAICLLLAASAMAQNGVSVKDKMLIGGYLGYTLGLGDPFGEDEYRYGDYTYTSDFGTDVSFGGHFHYGVTDKLMIGGELGFQNYSYDVSSSGGSSLYGYDISGGTGDMELNILATALYAMNYTEDDKAFFLTFGAGIYGGSSSDFGINGGIIYRTMVSEKVGLYGMPRFHVVLSDPTLKMLQLAVGLFYPLGSKN